MYGLLAVAGILLAPIGVSHAETPHIYVNIAAATLPEPGNPVVEVFADAGGVQRSGDIATMPVIYALGAPQLLRGQPTAYVSFKYEANCAAKTLRLVGYDFHAPDGAVTPHPSTDPAGPAATGVPATTLLLACGKAAGAKGYSDIKAVLADAAAYVKSQRAIDPAVKHSFVFTGLSKGTDAGPVRFYVDTATLDRSVDPIVAYTVEVFEKPIGPQIKPGAYTLSAMSFACKAKTAMTTYSVLYETDGGRLEGGVAASPTARDIKPDTIQDKMLKLVCDGKDPGFKGAPHASVAAIVAAVPH